MNDKETIRHLLSVLTIFEKALEEIASSHPERVGYDQTDIDEVPDLSAEEALNIARKALMDTAPLSSKPQPTPSKQEKM